MGVAVEVGDAGYWDAVDAADEARESIAVDVVDVQSAEYCCCASQYSWLHPLRYCSPANAP